MHLRAIVAVVLLSVLTGWSDPDPSWPYAGPTPDEAVAVRPLHYAPIGAGTKSYHPVEPMPWGDVNKRVAPAPPNAKPDSKHDAQ